METIEQNRAIAINSLHTRSKLAEVILIAAVDHHHMHDLARSACGGHRNYAQDESKRATSCRIRPR